MMKNELNSRKAKQRARFIELLKQLFQLDQPDLDFGFYKIMHAKADAVSSFIEKDLLQIMEDTFGKVDETDIERGRLRYEKELRNAKIYGSANPDEAGPVKLAKKQYDRARDGVEIETDIYDHLYRFFSRYYEGGDFLSLRYYTYENQEQAKTYAVPYDGREVYLHWANHDQFYTKTSEHLNSFSFDLVPHFSKEDADKLNLPKSLKLHFHIVAAHEGEHNNNKGQERYFVVHRQEPLKLKQNGEPVMQFEYRHDAEKKKGTAISKWQEFRADEAESAILKSLSSLGETNLYNKLLNLEIGEEKSRRTLLRKYINQYTKRNTNDYFIHKDLGGFLTRELNFYIKNEVMHLDDIESSELHDVYEYLERIKVLRKLAGQIIDILAQLENFQKKLWLKKKFVVNTNYCMTLDRIPEEFYERIGKNKSQIREWEKLYKISQDEEYKKADIVSFMKGNRSMMLDTAFFDDDTKDAIVSNLSNLDEECDGLLLYGDNFHALKLMQNKYSKAIGYIYIDPPYNAKSSEIIYKNSYKHSSWLSLMSSRIHLAKMLQSEDSNLTIAIDENEGDRLSLLLSDIYAKGVYEKTIVSIVHNPQGIQGKNFSYSHDYAVFITPNKRGAIKRIDVNEREETLRDDTGNSYLRTDAKNCFYPIYVKDEKIIGFGEVAAEGFHPKDRITREKDALAIWPIRDGVERKWVFARQSVEKIREDLFVRNTKRGLDIYRKIRNGMPKTVWHDSKYDSGGKYGTKLLVNILGDRKFDFPKSLETVAESIKIAAHEEATVLDYFAGSGTTAHAVIKLNRENKQNRKYILVEMGAHLDEVIKPRIQKVVYSDAWKDGMPLNQISGVSHCFKYISVETYEDTLNNLELLGADKTSELHLKDHQDARHEYMLNYWLDIETQGSMSLLNIDAFDKPTSYKMKIKKAGSNEYEEKPVDLVETFNWLIGLKVQHLGQWKNYTAKFKREPDAELPRDQETRLLLDGKLTETAGGKWQLRKITGQILINAGEAGKYEKALIIWRNLTGNLEEDNLILNEWFKREVLADKDNKFDIIYVNGSSNLHILLPAGAHTQVRLLEEMFHKKMWELD